MGDGTTCHECRQSHKLCECPEPAQSKCPMCGIPYTEHDGLIPLCRRYHRLRAEIRALINEWKSEPSNKTVHKIAQLEWALDAAQNNQTAK